MIKSILVWPREIRLGWSESSENKSEDTHHSEYAAKCVYQSLIHEGFGCDRKDFPVEARVEVDGVVKFRYTEEDGYLIDEIKLIERYPRGWHPDRCY
jgi:hypothetical protein